MSFSEIPIGLALIPCDTIIEDKHTGKKSLIGLISRVTCKSTPALLPKMGLMVSMTGGLGTYACEVLCTHHSLEQPIFSVRGKIHFEHPSQVLELIFQLERIQFPTADTYNLQVLVDDVLVMTRPLQVVLQPPPKQDFTQQPPAPPAA